jgi:hypothetical protein
VALSRVVAARLLYTPATGPINGDRLRRPPRAVRARPRALVLAKAGDLDTALQEIERLLTRPSFVTAHTLRLDPRWDPIRDDPRFKALLVKYASPDGS